MADNVGYTPGAGAFVAADEIGGVLHQRIKIGVGEDGTAVDVSAANPMPVDIKNTTPVPVSLDGISTTNPVPVFDSAMETLLTRMLLYLNSPQGYDKNLQRSRVTAVLESGTVSTVSTVNNVATIDTLQGRIHVYGANLSAWADTVRARIT